MFTSLVDLALYSMLRSSPGYAADVNIGLTGLLPAAPGPVLSWGHAQDSRAPGLGLPGRAGLGTSGIAFRGHPALPLGSRVGQIAVSPSGAPAGAERSAYLVRNSLRQVLEGLECKDPRGAGVMGRMSRTPRA